MNSGAASGFSRDDVDYKMLFEASPDVLLVLLPDAPRFTMVAATRARLQATHLTREQTIGLGLFEVFPDNPDDPAATGMVNLRASLDRVLATKQPDTMAVQKYDIRGPDGDFQVRYWSPRNLPVLSETGEITHILHCVEDVTELVRSSELGEELRGRTREMEREVLLRSSELAAANLELRTANAKLGELDAVKTAFFSNVSHEFRTPLTLMLGPIEDCLSDAAAPLTPEQRTRLRLAHENALRLLKLVNVLLDFSRIEAGRIRAHFAPIDLALFTAELAGMFPSAAARAGIELKIACPSLSGPVWVDRDMWEKIVPNLLSNAFKFTLAGEIAVRLMEERECVVLEVADTGVGIPEVELARIFDRFHRVQGQDGRTQEGTGIGLSLVRELVNLHGGQVTVSSAVGKGSTFRVEIPKGFSHLPAECVSQTPVDIQLSRTAATYAAEVQRWTPESRAPDSSESKAGSMGRPRVLLVDDNADLREYIHGLLAPDYEVTVAPDGQAALECIRAQAPDIVLSDVMMPRLDGLGLLNEIRANPATATVPVILLSARAGEEAAIEGLDAGSDDYLVKPFSARELLARVRTHVEMARIRRKWILDLEHANRELDSFSYSVSHDLRAPLRALNGFSRILVEDYSGVLDEEGRGYLQRIASAATRMAELIDGLLTLSRVARSEIERSQVDITRIAQEVGERLRGDPLSANRRVSLRVEDNLAAEGDAGLLRVVFDNLLGNAWKYSAKNPDACIEIGRADTEHGPAFFVRDNGAGFDMAYSSKLFGAFQRLHEASEFEGTGIGLATVQRIIRRHGGYIWAHGEVGKGATFYFTLC